MVSDINRTDLLRLMEDGAQVVDVLPKREYSESHIPGAVSLPLRDIDAEHVSVLRRDKPVVVY